jgi:hypothetical protein
MRSPSSAEAFSEFFETSSYAVTKKADRYAKVRQGIYVGDIRRKR